MMATVISTPSPGTARPSTRTEIGSLIPSTTWKIHTSAATLMISGTVTKNPVMKLRRSHDMYHRIASHATVTAASAKR